MRTKGEVFIDAVNTVANTELDINVRADAFRVLSNSYFDNESFPGITEALVKYGIVYEEMSSVIYNADSFIKYVNKADYAIYVTAKQENLNIAKTFMELCVPEYRGVAEAMDLYDKVQEFVNQQVKNAKEYIEAVSALKRLSGDALIAGIEKAQKLQKAGNVLGVDGVTEANIELNQRIAEIELEVKYSTYFLGLVEVIDMNAPASEIYSAIRAAKAAEVDADPWYAGVNEASIKLAGYVREYNNLVYNINDDFTKCNEVAAKTCGVGKTVNTVSGKVIAVIMKFFDED